MNPNPMKFIQFLMPDGRRRDESIERDPDIEAKATELNQAGFRFEIEMLRTGEISMECCSTETNDRDAIILANRICENGPPVPDAVDSMVNEAYQLWVQEGKQIVGQAFEEA